jgi:predicted nucleotidyltransferase
MTRDETLERLAAARSDLDRFDVQHVYLFGSTARDEAKADSDVDVLVEFRRSAMVGMFKFVQLRRFLSELLGRPVDLATPAALHPALRDDILREAIRAA